jgi:16S rRNA (guanine527-N7)-methyltransferase
VLGASDMSVAQALAEGLQGLRLELSSSASDKLVDYVALLQKWNRVYNLTAQREPRDILTHHILDCLAIVPRISGTRLLDVGSGAGLPGILLSLALPRTRVTLLDSNHKKAAFLKQAAIELSLDNVSIVCDRVESWNTSEGFDLVVSRALTDLPEFVRLAGRLVGLGGALAAMKGIYPHEELALLPAGWRVKEAIALKVPGLRAERHWVVLEPSG